MAGPRLIVSYQSEMPMSAFHNSKFDEELEQIFADIAKYLKKEYKKITGDTLSLKENGKVDFILQNMSKIRTWVQATKVYTVGNMPDVISVGEPSKDRLEANFKKFLELSTDKNPENVTRKDA